MVSGQDKEDMIREARKLALRLGIRLRENDDPMSIMAKMIGLRKEQILRLLNHIGWEIYRQRGEDRNRSVTLSDIDYSMGLWSTVAFSTGIPLSLRGHVHPQFEDFIALSSLACVYFAYYHREINNCSQVALRWLFLGMAQRVRGGPKSYSILTEVDRLLKDTEGKQS
jgi:hypothetical protein